MGRRLIPITILLTTTEPDIRDIMILMIMISVFTTGIIPTILFGTMASMAFMVAILAVDTDFMAREWLAMGSTAGSTAGSTGDFTAAVVAADFTGAAAGAEV